MIERGRAEDSWMGDLASDDENPSFSAEGDDDGVRQSGDSPEGGADEAKQCGGVDDDEAMHPVGMSGRGAAERGDGEHFAVSQLLIMEQQMGDVEHFVSRLLLIEAEGDREKGEQQR